MQYPLQSDDFNSPLLNYPAIQELISELVLDYSQHNESSPYDPLVGRLNEHLIEWYLYRRDWTVEYTSEPILLAECGAKLGGRTIYQDRVIEIDGTKDERTATFALAHEFYHFLRADFHSDPSLQRHVKTFEEEANYFARNLLLPHDLFREQYRLILNRVLDSKNYNPHFMTRQEQLDVLAAMVVPALSHQFCVSTKTVAIQIKKLRLLKNDQNGEDLIRWVGKKIYAH